ncbi:response regulator transcription factor [Limnobacter humi]|uniref:Response regulator transcription factor n=1 Tax=Limnobacter humi TaxID=1778671 RepID=A0ABT1WDP3_9BURK|nr:response regulator transcription factor [Limnobacter humi]MCQ8895638.1 response regulator transcription factor [Limnobacter humi]
MASHQHLVLILEDHPVVSMVVEDACKDLVTDVNIQVVNSVKAAREYTLQNPSVLIADLNLLDSKGLDTLTWIQSAFSSTPTMIYTGDADPALRQRAEQGNALWLSKNARQSELFEGIEQLLQRSGVLGKASQEGFSAHNEHHSDIVAYPGAKPLTWRQVEIMTLTAQGMSAKQVAQNMGLSPETIRGHIREIFRRLEAANKAQAVSVFLKAQARVRKKSGETRSATDITG